MEKRKTENKKLSKAKKCNMLLKKQKGLMRNYESMIDFKDPVLFLIRNNGRVEFFEDVTNGLFKIDHSSGKELYVNLESSQILKFDYGKKDFRGYILYEDEFLPYPHKPILYAESMNELMKKAISDTEFLDLERSKIPMEMIWKILMGIAVIILAIAVGQYFTDGQLFSFLGSEAVEVAKEGAKQVGNSSISVKEVTNLG